MSEINDHLVLIAGDSAAGKSASLMNIRNQERWLYMNCEAGKRLPFRNQFQSATVTDPAQVPEAFDYANGNPGVDGLIVDTVTFLMDMYESLYVLTANDTQKAWGNYAQYFKKLMQTHIAGSDKSVIVIGHNTSVYDEKILDYRTRLNIKGSIGKGNGAEAYFSTVVCAKKIELKNLEKYQNSMLNITEDDELLGYKHVFQTRPTRETVNERIRSPMGMFSQQETFIDNDAQLLLDHLNEFYSSSSAA